MSSQPCLAQDTMKPCVIVHGGAFNIPDSYVSRYSSGTQQAAVEGFKTLTNGGSALDAVEACVRYLEDDSAFNAGHGAVLTEAGKYIQLHNTL